MRVLQSDHSSGLRPVSMGLWLSTLLLRLLRIRVEPLGLFCRSSILVTMTFRPSNVCWVSWSFTAPRLAISLPRMLHLDCLQVGDLSRVVPTKVLVWSLTLRGSRTGLVLGLTRSQLLSKGFMLRMVPGFPLKDASEIALSRFGFDEVVMPDPLPLPFSTADVIRKKARRVYITYARFLELFPTPGCSACENDRSNHSAECIARFPHMVVIKGLLLLPHFIASLPRHRCYLRVLRRIVQDASRLVLTWTLLKKFRLTVDFHQPDPVIHNLMLLKKRMTLR